MDKYMNIANLQAKENAKLDFQDGGPFGAVIVKKGNIIAQCKNSVLKDKDPTAHAEINAIRMACQKMKTSNLKDCTLYTTCYPCPMCLAACVWANIKTIYYGNTKEDADNIGFKDEIIYKLLQNPEKYLMIKQMDREETIKVFQEFAKKPKIY